jgi:hypothetical protein
MQERMTNGETLEAVLWRTKERLEREARGRQPEPVIEDEPELNPEDAYEYVPEALPF